MKNFLETPHHINASPADLAGNNGIGRYILLPGSDGRARTIADNFNNLLIKEHPRGHHLYTGSLDDNGLKVDVAVISSGMGCPSMEIILHELFHLGGKRFLRVGTAGSLQKKQIKIGDIVSAQASVRDESTTLDYAPLSIPAISSIEMMGAIQLAANINNMRDLLHTGIVHCKNSFYAREFYAGPKASENKAYMELLIANGVLASEMETAALFIQSQLYHHQLMQKGSGPDFKVIWGAILGIGAVPPDEYMTEAQEKPLTDNIIKLALSTIKILAASERS